MNVNLTRTSMCLIDKDTKEFIFRIPEGAPLDDRIGILKEQVLKRLIDLSNRYQNYQKAIDITQANLVRLISFNIKNRPWIKRAADLAGTEFINKVDETRRKLRGDSIIGVRSVSVGKPKRSNHE